jgi:hypothetical protein
MWIKQDGLKKNEGNFGNVDLKLHKRTATE